MDKVLKIKNKPRLNVSEKKIIGWFRRYTQMYFTRFLSSDFLFIIFHLSHFPCVKWYRKILCVWPAHNFIIIFGERLPCPFTGVRLPIQACWCVWLGIIGFPLAPLDSRVSTNLSCTATHWSIFFLYVILTQVMLL